MEGNPERRESLFLTRTDRAIAAVFVVGLVALVPFALSGYELAVHLLLNGVGFVMGFSVAELVVRSIGRGRRVGFFLLLVGVAWILGLALIFVLPYEEGRSLLFDSGGRTPLLLLAGGFVAGLADAGRDLLFGPSTLEEAREHRQEWIRAEIRLVVAVGVALAGLFGFLVVLYLLGAYVITPVLRYFLL